MTPAADPDACHFVAFVGFSAFERSALASFFRLAQQTTHTYLQIDAARHSEFLIADADHAASVDAVRVQGRVADTVFIGGHAPAGATAWLPRPIDPVHIVRTLDALVALRRAGPALVAAPANAGPSLGAASANAEPVDLLLDEIVAPALGALAARTAAPAAARGTPDRDVLVADDSAVARKFLMLRLQHLGYRVHLARDGEQALAMLAQRAFQIVFLDVTLGGPGSVDGLQICQQIKRSPNGPAVLLVTGHADSADLARGALAGCDAYLTKPLADADFIAALLKVDRAFMQARGTQTRH